MTITVILNPYANRWRALQRQKEVEAALTAAGIEYRLELTTGPGHATQLAAQAARACLGPVIAAGGDGTVGEVINGLIQAAGPDEHTCPLGLLPLGSGNDLIANLGLPSDLMGAAKVIAGGHTRLMDLGQVNGRFFGNNSAIGIEPTITLIQQGIHRIKGVARYLLATLIAISRNPIWQMDLEWEGGEYHGPANLVTVGNGMRTGGLFYIAPHADLFDGKLTFVHAYIRTRAEILRILPLTMKPGGKFLEHPAVHEIHSTWLRIHTEPVTPMHADGEIQSTALQDLEYRAVPGRLQVLVNP